MDKETRILMILGCYVQGLLLNAFVIPTLDGIGRIAWIAFNIWMWVFAPILILKAKTIEGGF